MMCFVYNWGETPVTTYNYASTALYGAPIGQVGFSPYIEWIKGWYGGLSRTGSISGVTGASGVFEDPTRGYIVTGTENAPTTLNITPTYIIAVPLSTGFIFSWNTINGTTTTVVLYIGAQMISTIKDLTNDTIVSRITSDTPQVSGSVAEGHSYLIRQLYPEQVSTIVLLIFDMFAIGIVIGVVGTTTNSLRKQKELSTNQLVRSFINMVLFIIIGLASLAVIYSIGFS
jgi:hypothetical protein